MANSENNMLPVWSHRLSWIVSYTNNSAYENLLHSDFSFLPKIKRTSPGLLGKPYVTFFEKLNSSFCSFTLSAVGPCPRPHINFNIVLPATVSEKKKIFWSFGVSGCSWLTALQQQPSSTGAALRLSHQKQGFRSQFQKRKLFHFLPLLTKGWNG